MVENQCQILVYINPKFTKDIYDFRINEHSLRYLGDEGSLSGDEEIYHGWTLVRCRMGESVGLVKLEEVSE